MASVMGICGGLVEPKSGNVEKVLVFLRVKRGPAMPAERTTERVGAVGGGRGRETLPLVGLFRGFRVWRVWKLRIASTRHEARGLGGLMKINEKQSSGLLAWLIWGLRPAITFAK